jgi:hypothetical protein
VHARERRRAARDFCDEDSVRALYVRPRAVRLIATRRKNITANADARAFFARFVALWTRFAF